MPLSSSLVILGNDLRAAVVGIFDPAGNQLSGFDSSRPANAAITTIPVSPTSGVILAANAARRQVIVTNESSKTLYLAFAATASVSSYTIPVPSGQTVTLTLNGYTGVISGIWSAADASHNARVTEITT